MSKNSGEVSAIKRNITSLYWSLAYMGMGIALHCVVNVSTVSLDQIKDILSGAIVGILITYYATVNGYES